MFQLIQIIAGLKRRGGSYGSGFTDPHGAQPLSEAVERHGQIKRTLSAGEKLKDVLDIGGHSGQGRESSGELCKPSIFHGVCYTKSNRRSITAPPRVSAKITSAMPSGHRNAAMARSPRTITLNGQKRMSIRSRPISNLLALTIFLSTFASTRRSVRKALLQRMLQQLRLD